MGGMLLRTNAGDQKAQPRPFLWWEWRHQIEKVHGILGWETLLVKFLSCAVQNSFEGWVMLEMLIFVHSQVVHE